MQIETDGSSPQDARRKVRIDRSIPAHRWRFTCPEGCSDWVPTNSHIICRSCARAAEHGADVEVEYYEIVDQRNEETIPWSAVELV